MCTDLAISAGTPRLDGETRSFTNRLETRTKESTECASVLVIETIRRAMKVRTCEIAGGTPLRGTVNINRARSRSIRNGSEAKHIRWDPKDSELFLGRRKPDESLVDVRTQS